MPRPRTPLSSYGTINLSELQPGKWRARTRYRFMDGKSRQIERFGATSKKAEIALKTALVGIEADAGGELKPSTRISDLAQRFLVAKRDAGRAEGSLTTYGSAIKMHISPKIGDLSVSEAKPEVLQRFLTRVEKENGPGAAKNCRSALSGMLGIAVRNGAIAQNPVRELERITRRKSRAAKAIPLAELPIFLERLRADPKLVASDTVELIEFMLVSGWRVAEACALYAESVDFKAGTATVEAINIRIKQKGVVRQGFPKTEKSSRVTPLPEATMAMLARRRDRLEEFTPALFPTPLMRLRDPSNTQRELRESRDSLGYPELSTHSFRKTVATVLGKAGMSVNEVADYLGHENPSLTMETYLHTLRNDPKPARILEEQLKGLF